MRADFTKPTTIARQDEVSVRQSFFTSYKVLYFFTTLHPAESFHVCGVIKV